jgi:hypothetical protein
VSHEPGQGADLAPSKRLHSRQGSASVKTVCVVNSLYSKLLS